MTQPVEPAGPSLVSEGLAKADGQPHSRASVAEPAAGAPVAMAVSNLTVFYEARAVLRAVSFAARRGELIGIIGPNGAGKSTLLKAILGLIRADSGSVAILGQPVDKVRKLIAYVPQTEAVDWDFPVTVLDVVLMGRHHHTGWLGIPRKLDHEQAIRALEQVGMADYKARHIRKLSGGQQQRVFLARAICQEAQVLLLDEPFAGVDAATERAIFGLMDQLKTQGKTLLVVNHDLSVLQRFDSLLMLNVRLIASGPTSEVATPENLQRTYGGRLALLERADAALRGGVR